MAYANFDATEARGMWSPPNGSAPQMIPDKWRDNPGDPIRTDLPDKTDDELVALGWKKVIMPSYEANGAAFFNNSYEWNSSTRAYDATELEDEDKLLRVNYNEFWRDLLDTGAYTAMKTAASTTLAANVLYTEFITLIQDAKSGLAKPTKIQASITAIIAGITFTSDERTQLQNVFDSSGMSSLYTLS